MVKKLALMTLIATLVACHPGRILRGIDQKFEDNRSDLAGAKIESEVEGHTVTLSGTVSSDQSRNLAESLALEVPGVSEVHNQLRVVPSVRRIASREPRDMMEKLGRANVILASNKSLGQYAIKIDPQGDVVFLSGFADSGAVKRQLVDKIRESMAPYEVVERVSITTVPNEILRARINRLIDQEKLSPSEVRVEDQVAYLSGDAVDHREIDQLISSILMVPGVRDVKSRMTILGRPYSSADGFTRR